MCTKTLRVGSVIRMSVAAILVAFVITPNAANAEYWPTPNWGKFKYEGRRSLGLFHQCKAFPKEKGCLPAASWCEGWDALQKCCYQWHCGFVS